jgi:hypothetical protein
MVPVACHKAEPLGGTLCGSHQSSTLMGALLRAAVRDSGFKIDAHLLGWTSSTSNVDVGGVELSSANRTISTG